MEIKVLPSFTTKKDLAGRAATGIFAVHGHLDYVGDVSHPGSMAKSIAERLPKGSIKYFWAHNMEQGGGPPIAVVQDVREITRDQLPDAVLQMAPDATGGVEVTRKYLQTVRGEEILQGIAEGAITEQSYGYDPIRYDFEDRDSISGGGKRRVRHLRELRLWEISDVNWGANDATLAAKFFMPLPALLQHLKARLSDIEQEIKAGRRNKGTDQEMINEVHSLIAALGATNCKGLIEPDADEADEDDVSDTGEGGSKGKGKESDKEKGQKSGGPADLPSGSLVIQKARLDLLELEASLLVTDR